MSNHDDSEPRESAIGIGGDDAASLRSALPRVDAPALAPGQSDGSPAADAASEPPAPRGEAAGMIEAGAEALDAPEAKLVEAEETVASCTALVLAVPVLHAEPGSASEAAVGAPPRPEPRVPFRMLAAAAALGGLVGSFATVGLLHWAPLQSATPSYYAAFSAALGRVDHELSSLKTAVDTSTKSNGFQVEKLADRVQHVEKVQADSGAKLAKAADFLDRVERRLNTPPADVTGSVADPRPAAGTEARRTALAPGPAAFSGPVVDGWVVRDVYNGAAMIQGRAGVFGVLPGDTLPGLGRIESVKRLDGRWVVVTSRGLILSR